MKEFSLLQHSLLCEEGLEITHLDAAKIPSDNDFELSILLAFELKDCGKFDKVFEQIDAFTVYLDSISLQ
jgi:hypothetical protein